MNESKFRYQKLSIEALIWDAGNSCTQGHASFVKQFQALCGAYQGVLGLLEKPAEMRYD